MPDAVTPVAATTAANDDTSQSNTPWYLDKAFYLTILGFLLPIINSKFNLGLSATEVVAVMLPIVAFIAGHKWKSGSVLTAEIQAKSAAQFQLPPGVTPQQVAAALAQFGSTPAVAKAG